MERAACRGMDTNKFFPESGQPDPEALMTCLGCPVARQCKDYADKTDSRDGTWGGAMRYMNSKKKG